MQWQLTTGVTFAIYNPLLAPVMPTPANFMASWVADRCNIVFCVPVFVEVSFHISNVRASVSINAL